MVLQLQQGGHGLSALAQGPAAERDRARDSSITKSSGSTSPRRPPSRRAERQLDADIQILTLGHCDPGCQDGSPMNAVFPLAARAADRSDHPRGRAADLRDVQRHSRAPSRRAWATTGADVHGRAGHGAHEQGVRARRSGLCALRQVRPPARELRSRHLVPHAPAGDSPCSPTGCGRPCSCAFAAMVFAIVIGVPLGFIAALKPGSLDRHAVDGRRRLGPVAAEILARPAADVPLRAEARLAAELRLRRRRLALPRSCRRSRSASRRWRSWPARPGRPCSRS